jgi:outer membrane protein TolC
MRVIPCVLGGILLLISPASADIDDTVGGGKTLHPRSSHPVLLAQSGTVDGGDATRPFPNAIQVTLPEAILIALENNRALRVQRIEPMLRRTIEDEELAVFDPAINAGVAASRERGETVRLGGNISREKTEEVITTVGISKFFSTGTTVGLDLSTDSTWSNLYSDRHETRTGVTITQALLRGIGTEVNLARVRQAGLDTRASQYELRGFTESLVSSVEQTYWDYALARRQIEIVTESLKVAEQQRKEAEIRIKVGKLPEIELAAAQAEVALRREALIEARSTLEQTHLLLLRLLNPPGPAFWERHVVLRDRPVIPDTRLDDVESHVGVALRMRPDLNQARLQIQRGALEIVQTKNGLLPRMDLFVSLGKTGYADSFGDSIEDLDGKGYDVLAGVTFDYSLGNRAPRARHRRALLDRDQSVEALENLVQLVEVDVRSAFIEVNRAREQVAATTATRRFSEETVRAEQEKFRVGKSTSFLVGRAQRDLLVSQIAEVRAVANYLKAFVELYRLEGSLLERRGISAPGDEPVELVRQR